MEFAQNIGRKWIEYTKNTQGNFLRYIDGNTKNDDVNNLQAVSPYDAMEHITEWTVDWYMPLTLEEITFVRNNAENFKVLFTKSRESLMKQ